MSDAKNAGIKWNQLVRGDTTVKPLADLSCRLWHGNSQFFDTAPMFRLHSISVGLQEIRLAIFRLMWPGSEFSGLHSLPGLTGLGTAAAQGGFSGILHLLTTFLLPTIAKMTESAIHAISAPFGMVKGTWLAHFVPRCKQSSESRKEPLRH